MYQHTVIAGFVYRDPVKQYTPAGVLRCRIPVVVKEQWADNRGQRHEKETRYSVFCQGKLAEIVSDKVMRGQTVLAVGKIEVSSEYEEGSGERLCLMLRAQEVRVLSGPRQENRHHANEIEAEDEKNE